MKHINVRVYGLWVQAEGLVLLGREHVPGGRQVVKFPGGGLEWGEGLKDALKREWMEELGLEIEVLEHVYTTDFFQPSAFDQSQVISIYYKVQPVSPPISFPFTNPEGDHYYFEKVNEQLKDKLNLPIDKLVGAMWTQWCP